MFLTMAFLYYGLIILNVCLLASSEIVKSSHEEGGLTLYSLLTLFSPTCAYNSSPIHIT